MDHRLEAYIIKRRKKKISYDSVTGDSENAGATRTCSQ